MYNCRAGVCVKVCVAESRVDDNRNVWKMKEAEPTYRGVEINY